jgi:hypothetical protein
MTNEGFGVSLYNVVTFQSFYVYSAPNSFQNLDVPAGSYDVSIATGSPSPTGYHFWVGLLYHFGSGFTGSSVNLSATANSLEWQYP